MTPAFRRRSASLQAKDSSMSINYKDSNNSLYKSNLSNSSHSSHNSSRGSLAGECSNFKFNWKQAICTDFVWFDFF